MTKISALPLPLLTLLPSMIYGQTVNPATSDVASQVEEVIVSGVRKRLYEAGTLLDVIQKKEVVDDTLIKSMQAVNLTQAIASSPGVRVSNECSMCGVKGIMLNGMRGEHSTILTDGIPLHTMMAGYYAVDALATTGITRIEVARGAGASLLAPEAIGGAINVVSKEPERTGLNINMSVEDNGVSEAPLQDNTNFVGRLSWDFSDRDNLVLRAAYTDSEIFGGPQGGNSRKSLATFQHDPSESEQLFVNGNWWRPGYAIDLCG